MNKFAEMQVFVAVADTSGFSAAARRLGLAPSSVLRLVDALEERLGAKLLNRSTRSVTLTEGGRSFYERVQLILEQLDAADIAAAALDEEPQGVLRVTAPVTFSTMYLMPVCRELHRRYPLLQLDLQLSDGMSNMIDESIDVAIRIGATGDQPNVIARRLASHDRVICASGEYLRARGTPQKPSDLLAHHCLQFCYDGPRRGWRFRRIGAAGGAIEEVNVQGNFFANNAEMLRQAAVNGRGVAMLASWLVGADLSAGRLVGVLGEFEANPGAMDVGMFAMYPANRRGSVKVKAFIDLLIEQLAAHPGIADSSRR
ncbi:LysR family transcriptional regulator [Herbaspirillum sp. WKF16]|jgi:DNA-binding transcriptional LysR family regulator|uniref:LysR family transcriptional regulator n=1 Tax=Herbaspirillum sp. WKF16 TaxID=3028312 RepID=UPI0023A9E50F|nr:LysR family transcriptional regulator [Herbaspirillum sp. WKF16]WDZ94997.1 LysR family transcriptional regulator [Herbaspirillum sp. WKF16]